MRADLESREEKKLEIDEQFWELLLSADKREYENICAQYGITDFRWMLKKLNEKKLEREQEQEKVGFHTVCRNHIYNLSSRKISLYKYIFL